MPADVPEDTSRFSDCRTARLLRGSSALMVSVLV
jgi:hypothetical protein